MRLPTTREEMLERFRLYGEMFCTCCELCECDCPADIEYFEMCETPGLDADEGFMIEMTDEPDGVKFMGIQVSDDGMVMIEYHNGRYHASMPAIHTPLVTLRRINELLQRYFMEATRQQKLDFKED